jgi:Dipeptidyl aminopeptidases/acylaminoacyl-peptidases
MKKILLVVSFFAISIGGYAQQKLLSIDEAVVGQWLQLAPENLQSLQWKGESSDFTFQRKDTLFVQNVSTETPQVLFTLLQFNKWLKAIGYPSLTRLPFIKWVSSSNFLFVSGNESVIFDAEKHIVIDSLKVDDEAENLDYRPDHKAVAFTVKNNLYLSIEGAKIQTVTKDSNENIVNGQAVHRNEFGIEKGTFWSPKGSRLAFYRMDQTMVTDYPLVDITTRVATVASIKYPMAGMTSHQVKVAVYDPATHNTVYLKTGEPLDHYLTNIAWTPDEKFILVAELNRGQDHMKMNLYDAASGELVKTLFEETNSRYVEPLHPAIFLPNEPHKFLWRSQRDGYDHFYLYDISGKFFGEVGNGPWIVLDFLGFTKDGKNILYTSTQNSPIEVNVYKQNLKNQKIERLTTLDGTHTPNVNFTSGLFMDRYSSTSIPNRISIVNFNGQEKRVLINAQNPLAAYKMPEMSIFKIKAADDSTDLYCRLIKPIDFDSTKKYPVIVYVYGGPHLQLVNNEWLAGARLWEYYMAQKGYVMFTIDNRGSSNRGFAFESVIHRNLGVNEVADQMRGIDYLLKQSFVDSSRIGVHGWSFGGFLTTSLMLKENRAFKVGVAGGPVIDWKLYEVMYGERYMDTPEENPEGYKNADLINFATDLKGKLLIIHGAIDNTVVWQNSLLFLNECINKGVQVDYFVYPRDEHNVRGYKRIHLMRKITEYFDQNLMK